MKEFISIFCFLDILQTITLFVGMTRSLFSWIIFQMLCALDEKSEAGTFSSWSPIRSPRVVEFEVGVQKDVYKDT